MYYPEAGNTRGAPTQLLRGVEFGIETKALLFKRLCAYAGLHCEVVKGYSKSSEYLPGEEFVDTRYRYCLCKTKRSFNHVRLSRNTWNAVYAAGGWRLIQCNWAMLNLHSKAERETRKFYQDHYFLTDPDKFIFEFFPINSEWQLMEKPITVQVNNIEARTMLLMLPTRDKISMDRKRYFNLKVEWEYNCGV